MAKKYIAKYDCAKTLDYMHVLDRICESNGCCDKCPLPPWRCSLPRQQEIDIAQEWADEHL